MIDRVAIRPAGEGDHVAVVALLRGADLPLDGIPMDLEGFYVAEAPPPREGVVGVAGLEGYGGAALVRSVTVASAFRALGIGRRLMAEVLQRADADDVEEVFLLTTTARSYFTRFGFVDMSRKDLPEAVLASAELQGACPETAHVMRRPSR